MADMLSLAGGAEKLAGQIAMGLDPERFTRTLCITRWDPEDERRKPQTAEFRAAIEAAGVDLILIERESKLDLAAIRPLWDKLRSGQIDVVHAHKHGSNVWATALGRAAGVPVVIAHEHTWSYEGQPLRRLLDRELIARGSDAFIAVSRRDRERMVEVERIPPEDVLFLPNGIPGEEMDAKGDLRAELGIGPDDPVVGTLAVMRPQKALDVLLRAVATVREEFPALKVVIAGDGEQRPALEALVDELQLRDTVLLLGVRVDVPEVLATLDVAVSSSDFEGSPLAVMEYMAAARPVVATRVGGLPDLIDDGVHGRLVPPQDPAALAEAIAELLRDPERARAMGARGRERQRSEFDLGVMVRRIESLYESLLAGKRNGSRPSPAPEPRAQPVASLDAAREEWTELAERSGNPFATWEWADAWWRAHGDGNELRVSTVRRPDGSAAGILPLYRARRPGLRVLRFIGHGEGDQLGPVCARDDARDVAWALRRTLADSGGWDLFVAERMAGEEGWPQLVGGRPLRSESSPYLRFDGNWEEYLASRSRNFRDQARRRERKLRREHEVEFRLATDPDRLDADLTTLFRLHEARWEGAQETRAFAGPRAAFHRDFAARALERGWLRLWLLELDGDTVAAWYGFRFGGAEWFYQSGRDPAHDDLSIGFVLMVHTIRSAFDDGIPTYRLLRGGEEYKARFASGDDGLHTTLIAGTARGRTARAGLTHAMDLPPGARKIVRGIAGDG
jgi:glycosyltransferase involved in cell wall biosynthesis/CelD/BcsL family acetyltransferase involved in cellulose biosynthesis